MFASTRCCARVARRLPDTVSSRKMKEFILHLRNAPLSTGCLFIVFVVIAVEGRFSNILLWLPGSPSILSAVPSDDISQFLPLPPLSLLCSVSLFPCLEFSFGSSLLEWTPFGASVETPISREHEVSHAISDTAAKLTPTSRH